MWQEVGPTEGKRYQVWFQKTPQGMDLSAKKNLCFLCFPSLEWAALEALDAEDHDTREQALCARDPPVGEIEKDVSLHILDLAGPSLHGILHPCASKRRTWTFAVCRLGASLGYNNLP